MDPILIDIPVPIETPRLTLRPPQAGDGRMMNEAIRESWPELHKWVPWARGEIPTVEESELKARKSLAQFILRESIQVLIFERETGKFVGSAGYPRMDWTVPYFEIGYWLRTSSVGRGYALEAAHVLTRFAFEKFGARRVDLRIQPENARSISVATRLGFTLDGVLKNQAFVNSGQPGDMAIYSCLSLEGLPPLE